MITFKPRACLDAEIEARDREIRRLEATVKDLQEAVKGWQDISLRLKAELETATVRPGDML